MAVIKENVYGKKLLSDLLTEKGINIDKPCGGGGICGKCKIKVKGNLSPVSDSEKKLLTDEELAMGVRLACKTYVMGTFEAETEKVFCVEEIIEQAGKTDEYCAAIDIGTTVIEASFFSLPDFKLIKQSKIKNPQCEFGADVISRITFAKDDNGRKLLKAALEKAIIKLSENLSDKIKSCVITGNTTMLHLYSGIDPTPMARYPFKVPSHFGIWSENVFLPHCISAYVGADTVTAVLASGMMKADSPSLLVDIGTNGEIVLFDGKSLHCTSTAAGPALEGASISMGMFASKGAIKHVKANGDYETIENGIPEGICASGIIDAVCYMLKAGVINKDGYLENDFEIGDSGVFIMPEDIRKIQLAKAAIRAGIDTLLLKNGIKEDELKTVYIAGALGNNVDIKNCMKIGLIPDIENDRIKLICNAALEGCVMILKDKSMCEKTADIAKKAVVCELAVSDEFTKRYIECISF